MEESESEKEENEEDEEEQAMHESDYVFESVDPEVTHPRAWLSDLPWYAEIKRIHVKFML